MPILPILPAEIRPQRPQATWCASRCRGGWLRWRWRSAWVRRWAWNWAERWATAFVARQGGHESGKVGYEERGSMVVDGYRKLHTYILYIHIYYIYIILYIYVIILYLYLLIRLSLRYLGVFANWDAPNHGFSRMNDFGIPAMYYTGDIYRTGETTSFVNQWIPKTYTTICILEM